MELFTSKTRTHTNRNKLWKKMYKNIYLIYKRVWMYQKKALYGRNNRLKREKKTLKVSTN